MASKVLILAALLVVVTMVIAAPTINKNGDRLTDKERLLIDLTDKERVGMYVAIPRIPIAT